MATPATFGEMVEAIRADPMVGRGSCSHIDECLTDEQLADRLQARGILSRIGAVAWAKSAHRLVESHWGEGAF